MAILQALDASYNVQGYQLDAEGNVIEWRDPVAVLTGHKLVEQIDFARRRIDKLTRVVSNLTAILEGQQSQETA